VCTDPALKLCVALQHRREGQSNMRKPAGERVVSCTVLS